MLIEVTLVVKVIKKLIIEIILVTRINIVIVILLTMRLEKILIVILTIRLFNFQKSSEV